jgi:pseudouridine kinase
MADVVVIGGANIDVKAKAVSQHRLGTSNPGVVTTTAGGVGRNIAHNLGRLGVDVALISAVGLDSQGEKLLRDTAAAGVDTSGVLQQNLSTGSYVALLDETGELVSAVSDMRVLEAITPELISQYAAKIETAKWVVADCNLPFNTLARIAGMAGNKLAVEPVSVQKSQKLIKLLALGRVFVATPNLDQAEALLGTRDYGKVIEALHAKGLLNVVIHAGEQGALVSDGEEITQVESQLNGAIQDVTGAGDAAMAGLVFGLLQGEPLAKAAELGQALAGQVIASSKSTLE